MTKTSILILLLVASSAAGDARVRHLQLNSAHLIETTPSNFGLVSPQFNMQNWKTVSVNGNNLVFTQNNCQQALRSLESLSDAERQLILAAKQQLASVESSAPHTQEHVYRSGVATYSLNGQSVSMSFARNLQLSSFNSNGLSLTRYDDNTMSIAKPQLPNNIARVFTLNNDVLAYVHHDGQVHMRPLHCLQAAELQMVQQLRLEAQQAERQFQMNMQQFGQSMANMQQNMQNMQMRLQQNMNGMFGRPQQQSQFYQPQQLQFQQQQQKLSPTSALFGQPQQQQPAGQNYANAMAYAGGQPAASSFAATPGALQNSAGQPIGSGNFPFGSNNSPFYSGFPFGG